MTAPATSAVTFLNSDIRPLPGATFWRNSGPTGPGRLNLTAPDTYHGSVMAALALMPRLPRSDHVPHLPNVHHGLIHTLVTSEGRGRPPAGTVTEPRWETSGCSLIRDRSRRRCCARSPSPRRGRTALGGAQAQDDAQRTTELADPTCTTPGAAPRPAANPAEATEPAEPVADRDGGQDQAGRVRERAVPVRQRRRSAPAPHRITRERTLQRSAGAAAHPARFRHPQAAA